MVTRNASIAWGGRGLGFPIVPDESTRGLPLTDGKQRVRQAILIILQTDPGERIMRPDFGCGLRRYLMKPNTVATRTLMERDVARALARHEPRIRVDEIRILPGADPAAVDVRIQYTHVRDGSKDNLVYPFYLE